MSEEIKKIWDDGEIAAVRAWHESEKGFDQVEREINLPSGTLFRIVNEIPDYRGTRRSVGKWLRRMDAMTAKPEKPKNKRRPRDKENLSSQKRQRQGRAAAPTRVGRGAKESGSSGISAEKGRYSPRVP